MTQPTALPHGSLSIRMRADRRAIIRRMTRERLAASLCALGVAATILGAPPAAASDRQEYVDVSVGETPTAVAISDTGLLVASLHDAQEVALVDAAGVVRRVPLGCSPNDVAIAPSGETAWAVCQSDEHLNVIDVVSGEVSLSSVGATGLDDIVYLPAVDQLLIASIEGQVITVSEVSVGGYVVTSRVRTAEWRVTQLAPYPDGSATYAITDAGDLILVAMEFGGQVVQIHRATRERFFLSIALNPWTTGLYAAVVDSSGPAVRTAVELVDTVTADARQSVDMDFTLAGTTNVALSVGYRGIYVAAGLAVQTPLGESGLLRVPVSERGVLGSVESTPVSAAVGSGVALSHSGARIAFGTTNATVVAAQLDDRPYVKAVRVTAAAKGKVLRIGGTTTSLPLLTRLNVFVKDLTAKKSRFIKQTRMTVVTSDGTISWKGKAPSRRIAVYVAGDGVRSTTITVVAR